MDEISCVRLLEEHDIKPTANRIVVVKALASSMLPQSLAELEHRIGTIDKSNVFRALTLFREHHLVHTIEGSGDGTKYELCHSHDHEHDDDQHPISSVKSVSKPTVWRVFHCLISICLKASSFIPKTICSRASARIAPNDSSARYPSDCFRC